MFKVLIGILIGVLGVLAFFLIKPILQNPGSSTIQSEVSSEKISEDIGSSEIVGSSDLAELGSDKYADGELPLGDGKYVTDAPKKGYIYLCNVPPLGKGAEHAGSWIHGSSWNIKEKLSVQGKNSWPNAKFENSFSGTNRVLTGNDLPISGTTGNFPIDKNDPAYQYDRNPNSISSQTLNLSLPKSPQLLSAPACMGMEVGVLNNGVVLLNGFDAALRDAAAHEVQDSCQGHPQSAGLYHYHSLTSCINNISASDVIGYALDGFPITGPTVSSGKYLTTEDLDECHGITSEINLDGKKVNSYHYVMTQDFPYSVSCFRGKPVSLQVINTRGGGGQVQSAPTGNNQPGGNPPQEAIDACSGKSTNSSCSFNTPGGNKSGTCRIPPGKSDLICVP